VYKMKPGTCSLKNIEYDTTATYDGDGFRVGPTSSGFTAVTIGDSPAHGFGVGDQETFSYLLGAVHRYPTRNLGISSFATLRELEVLKTYGDGARYVILQYCENDFGENTASLRLREDEFRAQVEMGWRKAIEDYHQGKAEGIKRPLADLAQLIV